MIILSQARNKAVNLDRVAQIAFSGFDEMVYVEAYKEFGNVKETSVLGAYTSIEKAKKIIQSIAAAYELGATVYYMPREGDTK